MTKRRDEEEFYEAMPGTMQGTRVRRERELNDYADREQSSSVIGWVALAAVILLGLLLLGTVNARSRTVTPGANTGNGVQNLKGSQPGSAGGTQQNGITPGSGGQTTK
ncbi:MAG TPA: hypothetical protein VGH44_01290 [Candidatus Saccharimonadia bacterium]|jgi:hypothetical protein